MYLRRRRRVKEKRNYEIKYIVRHTSLGELISLEVERNYYFV
jgi:hypothetical protein